MRDPKTSIDQVSKSSMNKKTRHTGTLLNRQMVGEEESKPPKEGDPRYTCSLKLEPFGAFGHGLFALHVILNAY